jgi:hypothetical protein
LNVIHREFESGLSAVRRIESEFYSSWLAGVAAPFVTSNGTLAVGVLLTLP